MTDRELMQQALEALEFHVKNADEIEDIDLVLVTALRERLAQPEQSYPDNFIDALMYDVAKRDSEAQQTYCDDCGGFDPECPLKQPAQQQEPVAWMHPDGRIWTFGRGFDKSTFTIPLYTTPPQRTWVGLTDEELAEFSDAKLGSYDLCLEVEAKLKEKNHG